HCQHSTPFPYTTLFRSLSQLGMIRHWTRLLGTERNGATRRQMQRSRVVNSIGLVMTAGVLTVVLVTKFLTGAWIAITAMVVIAIDRKSTRLNSSHVKSS